MKVLVTGGGGFLGKAIIQRLLARGDEVRSLGRRNYPELHAQGVAVLQGDVADPDAVITAAQNCDLVFHVAAKASLWGRYDDFYQTNVRGSENVLDACRHWGISRLVYTSSPSVVFNGCDMEGIDESAPYPAHYDAPYPSTKALAEKMVLAANSPELATVALRPHLIWGPGDNHLVPFVLERGRKGQLRRLGNRPVKVDCIYIDNAADAHLLAAERLQPRSPIAGKAYFVSQGEPMALWDLVNRILEAAGLPPVTRTISPRLAYLGGWMLESLHRVFRLPAEPRMTRFLARGLSTSHWFDLTAARRDLGYEPKITTAEGMRRLREWILRSEPIRPNVILQT